jgi:nucleotide-binding universal stress UspA family protein
MFKRILVAVDGSTTSDQALQEATKLAREIHAQLRIVHVVDTISISLDTEFLDPLIFSDTMIKNGKAILRKASAKAKKAGIPSETNLIEIQTMGHRIPEAIAADAEAWPADLIVICTHGRKGLSHLFLGSVAEGLMRVATKPVLLIRGK